MMIMKIPMTMMRRMKKTSMMTMVMQKTVGEAVAELAKLYSTIKRNANYKPNTKICSLGARG